MMTEQRRVYTAECNREAVRRVTEPGDGVPAAARNLGRNVKMLGRWKRQAAPPTHGRLGGHGQRAADPEERLRWRTAHQRLRMARAR
jgi:transposase-like protein